MFLLKYLLYPRHDYVWIEVTLIKETPKAILIEFDGKQAWLPKAWIANQGCRSRLLPANKHIHLLLDQKILLISMAYYFLELYYIRPYNNI